MIVAPNYIFKGIVTRVIDGDTLVMTVSPAFKIQLVEYKFRLHGIDTHELNSIDLTKRKLAVEAKEVVRAAVEGKEVLVRTIKNTKGADHIDSFGRYLVEIFYSDPKDGRQINLNQELLDLGLAIKWAD